MIFIVEMRYRYHTTIRKEYQTLCLQDALRAVETDLVESPHLYINDIWQKGGSPRGLYGSIAFGAIAADRQGLLGFRL
jgi:hypothetical protein